MKVAGLIAAMAAAGVLLAGCSTMSQGMGGGELDVKDKPIEPVLFSWQSEDGGISGDMVATLPNTTYTGNFLQITRQTERTTMAPFWDGWNAHWSDWPYWGNANPMAFGAHDVTRFTREYSGKVVANLQNPGGQRMRCRFHLNDPAGGMSGGGEGECQLAGGKVVAAAIDRR
jgi:predicted small secreted protein